MDSEEWSRDQCKDFLHRSWFSKFSQKHADYFPFGNTEATDFLHDLDFQNSKVDLLMIGAGDIRSLLRTVSGLENEEHSKQRVEKLHVLLNDIDADIVARDVLLLHIIHTMDVNREEDFHFLWNVWYNLELPERHRQRLDNILSRLKEGGFGEDSMVSVFNQSTQEAVEKSCQQWQQCSVTVDQAKRSRMEAMVQIHNDLGNTESGASYDRLTNQQKKMDLLLNVGLNIQPYWTNEDANRESRKCMTQLTSYYNSGSADPYYGIPGKQWPVDRHDWKVNPTLLKADTTEYMADVTTSPYASYTPMQKSHIDDHPHLSEACFSLLKERVCIYRRLVKSQKLDLHIELCCEDAAVLLTSNALDDRNFDFIDTSNLADDMSLLAVLLLCQPKLREMRSVLRVESITWRHDHDTIEQYLQNELMGLDPLFFPTVLGLRLAESFQYGRRDMPTISQRCVHKGAPFCFRETLLWVKAGYNNASSMDIKESKGIYTYLQGLARRVFTDTGPDRRLQDPFVLFKLLQRIAPAAYGGMARLLRLVEAIVTGESELMYQWQVYRVVYGYANALVGNELLVVDAQVIKEQLPPKLSKKSFLLCDVGSGTPQRLVNVLFRTRDNTNKRVEVLMLKSHKDAIKRMLPIPLTHNRDHQSEILVENNFTTRHHIDLNQWDDYCDFHQWLATYLCLDKIREEADKYIVTVKRQLFSQPAFKVVNHNNLEINISLRFVWTYHDGEPVSFSCSIDDDVSVTRRDNVCHVTVIKKKEDIMGEHLLPLCKIQLHKLKPLAVGVDSYVMQYQMEAVIFPLKFDQEIRQMLKKEPEKSMKFVGREILLDLRSMLLTIVAHQGGDVLVLGPGSLYLKLGEVCWYNNTILRKVEVIIDPQNEPHVNIKGIKYVNNETLLLVMDLLRYNEQRVDQSGTTPGRYASFLQIHYPRANVQAQRVKEQQKLQEYEDVCANCRKTDSHKQCGACLSVKYCSKECQKLDYRRHKVVCKLLAASLCPSCQIKKTSTEHVCRTCRKTEYCSRKCKLADWCYHKKNCQ